jgi:CRP-like cAMP-binding protein
MSILGWVKLLKGLNKEELTYLEMFCQERLVKAGGVIFSEWDEANSMYLLKGWKIEVFKEGGRWVIILWHIESEDIFWEMALFWKKANRMAWARVLLDSTLIVILDFSIKELLKTHPKITDKIKAIIEERTEKNKKLLD